MSKTSKTKATKKSTAKPAASTKAVILSLRMPAELAARVAGLTSDEHKADPYTATSQNAVLCRLIDRGMKEVERRKGAAA